MEIKAKVISVFEPENGTSKAGNVWTKQGFLVETLEQYPKQIYMSLFGDRITQCPQVGVFVTVHFDIQSRSWVDKNGITRYSTDCNAWKVDTEVAQYQQQQQPQPMYQAPVNVAPQPPLPQQQQDELPF
jgi:hypothetical protein